MCGVVGLVGPHPANRAIYEALTVIQHRGQDAAGILTSDGRQVYLRKDNGLVRDVFHKRHMAQLKGSTGIGHVRYPTAGSDSRAEAQPFYVNSPFGLALGHNGNLTNADALRNELFQQDLRQLNTSSDSEILLNILAHELHEVMVGGRTELTPDDLFRSVRGVFERCQGAYAVVVMIVGYGLLAFRDRHGIRPLIYGTMSDEQGASHLVASESVAMDVLGFRVERDIRPGEALFIDLDGNVHSHQCVDEISRTPCVFEFVYLARPDSIIDDIPVHRTRLNMGERLAKKVLREWPELKIDVVIPVPDTSRTAALQMAYAFGVNYREGFIKNRYMGRTFIMPGQAERKRSVRQKLNVIDQEFAGKAVLLVDDSIVRGTTSKQIVQLARDAGAKKVYFASAAPPVRYPNVYGIDMPCSEEFVAHNREVEEIAAEIGADKLIYQDLEDLVASVSECNTSITEYETSCFDGIYLTGDVGSDYLEQVERSRRDSVKRDRNPNELDNAEVTACE